MMLRYKQTLLVLSMLLTTVTTTTAKAQYVSSTDSLELVRFYHALDGDNWFDNTGWLVAPVHEWYGITLYEISENHYKVFGIELYNNNLTGELIDLELPYLGYMGLGGNNINGKVPAFSQTNLHSLILSHTNITEFPDFNLPLTALIATDIQLTEIPSLEGVKATLANLTLARNPINSMCPSFEDFPNLRRIDLGETQLYGALPTFEQNILLEVISLDGNQLTGPIPDWSHLTNLTSIDIDHNQLSGELDSEMFKTLTKLNNLELNNNNFTGAIPRLDMPHLTWALFNSNNFTGCDLNLNLLPNVSLLWLGNNRLSFDWLEANVPNFSILWTYLPQKCQPILYQKKDTLFVEAGGTTALNEYRFYKDNVLIETTQGIDYLIISEPGVYSCRISNSAVPNLNLCAYDWEVQGFCEEEQACVLPGDANNNNSINVYDLPQIGRAYGNTGPARVNEDVRPVPHAATDWASSSNQINHKHADCDGNGKIDSLDANIILENYGEIGNEMLSPYQNDGIPLTIGTPDTVIAGVEYVYPIFITQNVVFYAISFQLIIEIANDNLRINDPHLSLANSFIDDDGSYVLSIDRLESIDNTTFIWHIGITRTNQLSIDSSGEICALACIMDIPSLDKLAGAFYAPISIRFDNIQLTDFEGNIYAVQLPQTESFVLESAAEVVGIDQPDAFVPLSSLQIYPNPVAHGGRLTIDCAACSTVQSVEFRLFDVTGKLVHQFARSAFAKTTTSFDLPNGLPSGLYFLVGQNHEGGVWGKERLVVM